MTDAERYRAAGHAMQSGVAMKMHFDPKETEPKHLRVGVNAAMSEHSALAKLLIDKGLITDAEYIKALTDAMEAEAEKYRSEISEHTGANITLG